MYTWLLLITYGEALLDAMIVCSTNSKVDKAFLPWVTAISCDFNKPAESVLRNVFS